MDSLRALAERIAFARENRGVGCPGGDEIAAVVGPSREPPSPAAGIEVELLGSRVVSHRSHS